MLRFSNSGEIDPRLITTLGVNVKENGSPIGYFGTGLKYAIAGILRNGGRVEIHSGLARYRFTCEATTIRGKEFQFIKMAGPEGVAELGFTTDLGKNWEPWMWYRELASNTMDEGGVISQVITTGQPNVGETNIYVTGLDDAWAKRDQIFISTEPLATPEDVDIHPAARSGSNSIFYRGVKVMAPSKPAMFQYNIKCQLVLTEDRTLSSSWAANWAISRAAVELTDTGMLETILLAEDGTAEREIDFARSNDNPVLDEVIERLMDTDLGRMNQSAVKRIKQKREAAGPKAARMTGREEAMLVEARTFMEERLGIFISIPVHVTEKLGKSVHGVAWNGEIYLARPAFENGVDWLISTLMEEWCHAERHMADYSRELQTWLFNKIVTTARGIMAEPIAAIPVSISVEEISPIGRTEDEIPF